MNQEAEIRKCTTFAVISHRDAGKTTLTENFLLFRGATAGAVKRDKIKKDEGMYRNLTAVDRVIR